ncbi:hypothetical protein BH718_01482 [Brachyspira hyodysenteriae]|nr:hypothetical protein BH718_01482 [Brachyspira hyodysenteriae]
MKVNFKTLFTYPALYILLFYLEIIDIFILKTQSIKACPPKFLLDFEPIYRTVN